MGKLVKLAGYANIFVLGQFKMSWWNMK